MEDSVKRCINNMKNFCEAMKLDTIDSIIAINGNPEPVKQDLVELGKKLVS